MVDRADPFSHRNKPDEVFYSAYHSMFSGHCIGKQREFPAGRASS